jgi:hypothetical protein
MIALMMIMLHVLVERMAEFGSDASRKRISRDKHSSLTDRTQRSA